jgi:hypothetical protein
MLQTTIYISDNPHKYPDSRRGHRQHAEIVGSLFGNALMHRCIRRSAMKSVDIFVCIASHRSRRVWP